MAAALFVSGAGGAALAECRPIAGIDALIDRSDARVVMIGELHGTAEIPAFVGDALCHFAARGPATLVIEMQPQASDAAIAKFLASAGSREDEAALALELLPPLPDARSSDALVRLIAAARALKAEGADIAILAYDPVGPAAGQPEAREAAMAETLVKAMEAAPDRRYVVFTGALHARKAPFGPTGMASAAQRLPQSQVVSLHPVSQGGEIWNCALVREPAVSMNCKPRPAPAGDDTLPMSVIMEGADAGFDGRYAVGGPFTRSPLHGAIVRTEDTATEPVAN